MIPNYESYAEVDFLTTSQGSVRAKKLGEKGWHVVIDVAPGETPHRVTLTATNWNVLRLLALRGGGRRLVGTGDSIELIVPADGVGWFFLLKPFPEVPVHEYRPKTLFKLPDNTPEKAKFPVVDIHVHLRGVTPEARLRVMDAVGVAIAIDSPLGTTTESSYERFEKQNPNRFLTLAGLDFSTRFETEFPANIITKLEADVDSMAVPGVSEVIDKGSGVWGHALITEPRGKVFVDDDKMMPIWHTAARLKLPLLLHVAEPI
ncbi:MAG: hypothetical protein HQ526_06440, partial [Actinobacteria bacterium]|nr:hypothetical protein [Actinomycetota bacterium]